VSLIGRTLSHYQIVEEISRGGMGVVYRALDARLNREVALKVLPPELVADRPPATVRAGSPRRLSAAAARAGTTREGLQNAQAYAYTAVALAMLTLAGIGKKRDAPAHSSPRSSTCSPASG